MKVFKRRGMFILGRARGLSLVPGVKVAKLVSVVAATPSNRSHDLDIGTRAVC